MGQTSAQDKMPYAIFDKNGKKTTYKKMVETAGKSQIVLFGEYHDNSIVHWLQLEFAKDLLSKKPIVMGAEMIESDNQAALNDYLQGIINDKQLDTLARLWRNYKTDYKPLVDFAKDKKLPFIATNIPRRFASLVYKGGLEVLENLPADEKLMMPPLPIPYDKNLPGYVKMMAEMGDHGGENLPKAQAVKDATMAHFILKNLKNGSIFLHFNGTYHSDNFDGINWYLKKGPAKPVIMTISTVSQMDVSTLEIENYNKADFIIVTDEDVTKTY